MTMPGLSVSVMNAIYHRRSIRSYTATTVDDARLHAVLEAAVRAPTARHQESWAFVIVQDKALLRKISDTAKAGVAERLRQHPELGNLHDFSSPDYNIFYNAGTLILICAKAAADFAPADCWLAAENLMLAAHAMGMGTCVIGLALQAVNGDMKESLGVPADMNVMAALIVGEPAEEPPETPRKSPQILRHFRSVPRA
jgi:nitroreductase